MSRGGGEIWVVLAGHVLDLLQKLEAYTTQVSLWKKKEILLKPPIWRPSVATVVAGKAPRLFLYFGMGQIGGFSGTSEKAFEHTKLILPCNLYIKIA